MTAARIMEGFADRTGLGHGSDAATRYLWTDAFALCIFLELHARTGNGRYRDLAYRLIDQVHATLGRFRTDDPRNGWISGLDDAEGQRSPTAGGLRIGKPLPERRPEEPFDDRLEWERDGQYFHYLTRWMHALARAARALEQPVYLRWAMELAAVAFDGFARRDADGEVAGLYWKMNTDLSRPQVPSMGLHDALDGLLSFSDLQRIADEFQEMTAAPPLDDRTDALARLCRGRDWTTDDPLGLGGLLCDAARAAQLSEWGAPLEPELLPRLLDGCTRGLRLYRAGRPLEQPAAHRLAFRELGLAIGLSALPLIARRLEDGPTGPRDTLSVLDGDSELADDIVRFWLSGAAQRAASWDAHREINEVMLATALVPDTYLN
ncbi:MAG: hypothetical protein TEF_15530 [Rhizobiales bacterium NRL2]|nr:MAG: hypothetical protein TEF_15530 [Rhizobiales bacterium NRL2]